ncbi:hypothetical protein FB451DRAFT_1293124 [Mycena latifolia]|nr:hypothetical protein FB451DRAFT_1293124 [Mycena latifolia]
MTVIDGTLGPLESGTIVGTFLFGILTLQAFNYYRQFPEDSIRVKITVVVIWLLELGLTICSLHSVYWITVTSYGGFFLAFILQPPRTLLVTLFFSAAINSSVQVFFGNRIRVLSGRLHIFFLCITVAILRFICHMALMATIWRSNTGFLIIESKAHWIAIVDMALLPVGDGLIAVSMCYYLWNMRESQFRHTRKVVDTLMLWTVETTVVTSVAAVLQLILFLTRTDLSFLAFYLIEPKLFSNSMLAVLNGRTRFRSAEDNIVSGPVFDSSRPGTRSRRDRGALTDVDPQGKSSDSAVIQMSPIPENTDSIYPEIEKTGP